MSSEKLFHRIPLKTASDLGKYLIALTVILDFVENIEILLFEANEAIWKLYLEHDIARESLLI